MHERLNQQEYTISEFPKGSSSFTATGVVTDLRSLIPNAIMPQTTRNFVSTHRFVEIILILYTLIGLFVIVYALKELASFITEKLCKSEAKRSTSE